MGMDYQANATRTKGNTLLFHFMCNVAFQFDALLLILLGKFLLHNTLESYSASVLWFQEKFLAEVYRKKENNTNGHCKNTKEKNSSESESAVYERHYQQHCIQVCKHFKSHKNKLMFQCNQHLMSQTTLHISKEKGCRYIYAEQTHKPGQ